MMTVRNDSLRYGFEYDRRLLLDITVNAQIALPILNTLFLHPTVLFLLYKKTSMASGIRFGYFSTVAGVMIADWIMFGLRLRFISPYAALYCDGPLCREDRLGHASIRLKCALIAITIIPCGFCLCILLVRMHQQVLRDSASRWLLSRRAQLMFLIAFIASEVLNLLVFTFLDCEWATAAEIAKIAQFILSLYDPELAWLVDRRGTLLVFVDFVLMVVAISCATHAPITTAFSLQSICNLQMYRKNLVSNRTKHLTNQMEDIFFCQTNGGLLHLSLPLVAFHATIMVDTQTLLSDGAHAALRFVISMLLITNPLQFSFIFVWKTCHFQKISSCFKSEQIVNDIPDITPDIDRSTIPLLLVQPIK